jgi:hypothetical protein
MNRAPSSFSESRRPDRNRSSACPGQYAALDRYVKLDVFLFKGSPDGRRFALVADSSAFGLTPARDGRAGPQVIVHVHHHVLHPGIPAALAGWEAAEVPQVTANGMRSVAAAPRNAIGAAPLPPADLGQRFGRLDGKARRRTDGR